MDSLAMVRLRERLEVMVRRKRC